MISNYIPWLERGNCYTTLNYKHSLLTFLKEAFQGQKINEIRNQKCTTSDNKNISIRLANLDPRQRHVTTWPARLKHPSVTNLVKPGCSLGFDKTFAKADNRVFHFSPTRKTEDNKKLLLFTP